MPPELGIGGERRVGGPPGYPGPDAVPSPPRNNLQFPEDLTTMQRSHGVGTPESAREHGRLPRFGKTGQVRMGGVGGWDRPDWEQRVQGCPQTAVLCDTGQVT